MNYNPFTYRGYYKDHESNLYYLINRYYSPDIEMFITPDSFNYLDPSTLYGLDLYTYCMFNPVMYVDPEGNSANWNWETFFKGVLLAGTAISAIMVSVTTFGLTTPLAMSIVAGITLGAGVLAGINGVATMFEAGTGYNLIRDGLFIEVFDLDESAYDLYNCITEGIAIVETIVCSIWNITNPIKGFTKHGKQSTLTHDGHGVNPKAMQDAVRKPIKVISQPNGGTKYIGKNANVVLNEVGEVITTYAKNHHGWRLMLTIWFGLKFLQEK